MKKALILLSGGLDSATCLAIAKASGFECYALSFDYGQRAQTELLAARKLCQKLGVTQHRIFKIDIAQFGASALTDSSIDVPTAAAAGIPITYVPARNTIFLSVALGFAEILNAQSIYIGANQVDYSGYPDCRAEYIKAFQDMMNLATKKTVMGETIQICTPLMDLNKSDIIAWGHRLGLDYTDTISCYQADEQGLACGKCDSCALRRQGFLDLNVSDQTRYGPS